MGMNKIAKMIACGAASASFPLLPAISLVVLGAIAKSAIESYDKPMVYEADDAKTDIEVKAVKNNIDSAQVKKS